MKGQDQYIWVNNSIKLLVLQSNIIRSSSLSLYYVKLVR